MRHSRLRQPASALPMCALLLLAQVLASGCGGAGASVGAPPTSTNETSKAPHIIVRSVSAHIPASAPRTTVSASCQTGEQLIGGGFSASDTFEYDARIVASYPASATTWTVAIASSPAFILRAEAYCLPARIALGLAISHASTTPSGGTPCPPGAVLLSGGFQDDAPVTASRPDRNGWYTAGGAGSTGQVYALCATQHVSVGSATSVSFNPRSSAHGYAPASDSVTCPAGQIAISGGFSGGNLILASASGGSPYQGWTVTAGGDGDMTLYAHCVSITA